MIRDDLLRSSKYVLVVGASGRAFGFWIGVRAFGRALGWADRRGLCQGHWQSRFRGGRRGRCSGRVEPACADILAFAPPGRALARCACSKSCRRCRPRVSSPSASASSASSRATSTSASPGIRGTAVCTAPIPPRAVRDPVPLSYIPPKPIDEERRREGCEGGPAQGGHSKSAKMYRATYAPLARVAGYVAPPFPLPSPLPSPSLPLPLSLPLSLLAHPLPLSAISLLSLGDGRRHVRSQRRRLPRSAQVRPWIRGFSTGFPLCARV